MGLKQRKLEKLRLQQEAEEIAKRESEIKSKIKIKKTLNEMKAQSAKLDNFKKQYIEKAKQATLTGDNRTANIAKSSLKICLSKQKLIDSMIATFEITSQVNDMNKVLGSFVGSLNIMSSELNNVVSTSEIVKAQQAYETALANNEGQFQALEAFLNSATESISSFDGNDVEISDEEVDSLISNGASSEEASLDNSIDEKISDLEKMLNSQN